MKKSALTLYIKTYGCQMNVYDSEQIAALFKQKGIMLTNVPQKADIIILNTCYIREKASEKIYSELGRLALFKAVEASKGRKIIIIVAGCVAQGEGQKIFRRAPCVDMVVGPQSYYFLPQLIAESLNEKRTKLKLLDSLNAKAKFDHLSKALSYGNVALYNHQNAPHIVKKGERSFSSFLSVQEGCNKFCSYCVVPFTRGREYSRPVQEIYEEAHAIVANGAKEITLLGQNVNAYNGINADGIPVTLGQLIKNLAKLIGLSRIRYTTSHPLDMPNSELINAHITEEKLMPYVHLPVQSGSDNILKQMNRRHTSAYYRDIINALRKANPLIAISSDFIVGYPGETDDDFQQTLQLVDDIGYAQAYSFKYSPRPGTPAATLPNQVEESVKSQRLQVLQQSLKKHQLSFNTNCIEKKLSVLIERIDNKTKQAMGKSQYMQSVIVKLSEEQYSSDILGRIIEVEIISAAQNNLIGILP